MNIVKLAGKQYERADSLRSRLGIGEMSLWRLVNEGMPKPVKIGRWRYFPLAAIDTWLLQRTIE